MNNLKKFVKLKGNIAPNSFYVYELINPKTNRVFYVGKGKGHRYLDHFRKNTIHYTCNKYKSNTINSILRENKKIIVKIIFQSNDENLCFDKEKKLILKYGRKNNKTGILTNINDGGEGASNRHTTKWKKSLKRYNPGSIKTSKPIYQINLDVNVIKKWKSIRFAAKNLKLNFRNISSCANYRLPNSVGNYFWRFVGDKNIQKNKLINFDSIKINTNKKLLQKDLNGNIVKKWNSITNACKSLEIIPSMITWSNKNNKPHKNFYWEIIND